MTVRKNGEIIRRAGMDVFTWHVEIIRTDAHRFVEHFVRRTFDGAKNAADDYARMMIVSPGVATTIGSPCRGRRCSYCR